MENTFLNVFEVENMPLSIMRMCLTLITYTREDWVYLSRIGIYFADPNYARCVSIIPQFGEGSFLYRISFIEISEGLTFLSLEAHNLYDYLLREGRHF